MLKRFEVLFVDLTDRKKQILKVVVEDYIRTAEPVGSKAPHLRGTDPLPQGLPAVRQRADGTPAALHRGDGENQPVPSDQDGGA